MCLDISTSSLFFETKKLKGGALNGKGKRVSGEAH